MQNSYKFSSLVLITLLVFIFVSFSKNNIGIAQRNSDEPTPHTGTSIPTSHTSTEIVSPSLTTTSTSIYTYTPEAEISQTPAPTGTATNATLTLSPAQSSTPTLTATAPEIFTNTVTTTITETIPADLTSNMPALTNTPYSVYFPAVYKNYPPVPSQQALFCTTPNRTIPDNNFTGISSNIQIADTRLITDLDVSIKITHSYPGDIWVGLTNTSTQASITLIDRPGYPTTTSGCGVNNIQAIMDDEITLLVEGRCAEVPPGIGGVYRPMNALNSFDYKSAAANWTLTVKDLGANDTGTLVSWCMLAAVSPSPILPPPTPAPPAPPSSYVLGPIYGEPQALPLDCESRSAVDWAKYFGNNIDEIAFYNALPHTDNPDTGFVGSVYGTWGQVPPNPYGVHAEPIAELLRAYGLPAQARRPLSWTELRNEIASGQPVIAWIIGSIYTSGGLMGGSPLFYKAASDNWTSIVAPYEHVVVVTGYDSSRVQYLNGSGTYWMNSDRFLESWSALGNMAVIYQP